MTDETRRPPEVLPEQAPPEPADAPAAPEQPATPPTKALATPEPKAPPDAEEQAAIDEEMDRMAQRLERLGGEPAPAISPQEFARLEQSGQIHIDSRGRIRTTRREQTDAGMSLRKRRAWYA